MLNHVVSHFESLYPTSSQSFTDSSDLAWQVLATLTEILQQEERSSRSWWVLESWVEAEKWKVRKRKPSLFPFFWCKASCWAVIWFRPIKDGTMKWTNHVFILNHFSFYSLAILRTFGGRSEIGPFTTWRFQPRRIVSNLRDWCTDSLCLDTFWYTLEQLLASHC